MSNPVIINSDIYKLNINLLDLTPDLSNNVEKIFYIINYDGNDNINCIFDILLTTNEIDKKINITFEQFDNDILKITEYANLTSSSATIKKNITLYTQLLKITLSTQLFNGNIYGNIQKTKTAGVTASSTSSVTVKFDKLNYDAFGRLRVSNPFTLFDSQNKYSKNEKFTDISSNNAHAIFNSSDSSVDLTVSDSLYSSIIRESKIVFSYQPGKSLLIMNTFVFNETSGNNLTQRVGYYTNYNNATYLPPFNPKNGIYLEASGSNIYMCKANNNNVIKIIQDDWNMYKFNGEAPYFVDLDLTKTQIYWIDIEWLGVGSVRTGFIINGEFIMAHRFDHANIESTTYMQTACLPVRYEIINNTTEAGGTLKQICSTVISEGGYESLSRFTHAGWGNSAKSISNANSKLYTYLVSIRLKENRFDSIVIPSQLSILAGTNDTLIYKILLNKTITNPNWISSGPSSNVEYDISGTVSDEIGTEINCGYITSNGVVSLSTSRDFNLQLGKYFSGSTTLYSSDTITVLVSKVGSSSAYDVSAMLGWFDIIK
jgi:hypothetical protein